MLTLRLARAGTKKRPVYHLVATDSRSRRDGRFIENLGYFIPNKDIIVLKQDRVAYWQKCGATTSEVAAHLIRTAKKRPAVVEAPKPARTRARPTKGSEKSGSEGDGNTKAEAQS